MNKIKKKIIFFKREPDTSSKTLFFFFYRSLRRTLKTTIEIKDRSKLGFIFSSKFKKKKKSNFEKVRMKGFETSIVNGNYCNGKLLFFAENLKSLLMKKFLYIKGEGEYQESRTLNLNYKN